MEKVGLVERKIRRTLTLYTHLKEKYYTCPERTCVYIGGNSATLENNDNNNNWGKKNEKESKIIELLKK